MVLAPSDVEPICVENIRLNCRTSVQLRVPEIGQAISQSMMIWRSSPRSLAFSASANRLCTSSRLAAVSATRGDVSRYLASSKSAPKRLRAFSTSFSIFSSCLASHSSTSTSAR